MKHRASVFCRFSCKKSDYSMIFISGTAYQPKNIDQYRPNVEIETNID